MGKKISRILIIVLFIAIVVAAVFLVNKYVFGAKDYIGKEAAREAAFKAAGITAAEAWDVHVDLEREAGRIYYDVEFEHNGMEYDYYVEAKTGEILASNSEPKDD